MDAVETENIPEPIQACFVCVGPIGERVAVHGPYRLCERCGAGVVRMIDDRVRLGNRPF